jgi:hypothetical protein
MSDQMFLDKPVLPSLKPAMNGMLAEPLKTLHRIQKSTPLVHILAR